MVSCRETPSNTVSCNPSLLIVMIRWNRGKPASCLLNAENRLAVASPRKADSSQPTPSCPQTAAIYSDAMLKTGVDEGIRWSGPSFHLDPEVEAMLTRFMRTENIH